MPVFFPEFRRRAVREAPENMVEVLDIIIPGLFRGILFLEAGVGWNTPGIIKYSFWRMAWESKNAAYACLNYGQAYAPDDIKDRSICINGDIGEIFSLIRN